MNYNEGVGFGKWFLRGIAIALGFFVVTFAVGGTGYFIIKQNFESKVEEIFGQEDSSVISDKIFIIETAGEHNVKTGRYTVTNLGVTGSLDIKDKDGGIVLYKIFDDKNKTHVVDIESTDIVKVEGTELKFVRE